MAVKATIRIEYDIHIQYEDESGYFFKVTLEGTANEIYGELCQITRGTLMASNAQRAVAYNNEGFDVCSYIK